MHYTEQIKPRCAACDESRFLYRHWTEQIKMRCADSHEVNKGLDAGTTLNRSR